MTLSHLADSSMLINLEICGKKRISKGVKKPSFTQSLSRVSSGYSPRLQTEVLHRVSITSCLRCAAALAVCHATIGLGGRNGHGDGFVDH